MDDELLNAKDHAYRIFGTTNLQQALEQAERDQDTIKRLHDRNVSQGLHLIQLDEAFQVTNTIVSGIDHGAIPLGSKMHSAIERYKTLYLTIEKRMQEALRL